MPNAAAGDDRQRSTAATAASRETASLATLVTVFVDSFKILLFNPRLFASILLLFALPLSLLLSTLSVSSATLRRRIAHLESLAAIISVRIEALNILEEARKDAKSLFRIRATYALPTLLLSTLVLVSAASFAAAPLLHRRRFTFSDVSAAVRFAWWRGLLTGAVGYLSVAGCGQLMRTAAVALEAVAGPTAAVVAGLVFGVLEIYLTAVFGVGAVVSVVEEKYGLDAFRVGSGLMAGRRAAGWAVAAAVTAVTGVIGWEMVGMQEIDVYGVDWKGFESTDVMEFGSKAGLVFLYGFVIVWSNVVLTVFYCDCRKKKLVMDDEIILVDNATHL